MSRVAEPAHVSLDWPHDPGFAAVGRLVLSGVAARFDLPVDRMDDLGLALDTLARWAVADDRLGLEIDVSPDLLAASLGTFVRDPLADPSIRRIVAALAGEVVSLGDPGAHRVVLTMPAR